MQPESVTPFVAVALAVAVLCIALFKGAVLWASAGLDGKPTHRRAL